MKISFNGEEINYDFECKNPNESDLKDVLSDILKRFKIDKDKEFYSLIQKMKFITTKEWKQNSTKLTNDVIELVDVRIFAQKCINELKDCYKIAFLEKDNKKKKEELKKRVFVLNDLLNEGIFSEEFIAFGGMEILILIIKNFNLYRNIQSYSLNSLCKTMMYLNGLEYIKQNKNIIQMLFSFIRLKQNVIVIRGSLYMLILITKYSKNSFNIINQSALNAVNRKTNDFNQDIQQILKQIKCGKFNSNNTKKYDPSKLPYFEIISCLDLNENGDLDIISNALKLIITLIKKANNKEKELLLDLFIAVGIMDKLLSLKNSSYQNEICQLLLEFQKLTEDILPCNELDVWILQTQIKKLHKIIQDKDDKIQDMMQKYAMIDILNDEFIRIHTALEDAYHDGLLVNAGLV